MKEEMDWRYNTIWYDWLDPSTYIKADWNEQKLTTLDLKGVSYVYIHGYNSASKSLKELQNPEEVLYLNLTLTTLKNLDGIERFLSLKRLEIDFATRFHDLSSARNLSDLQFIHINTARRFCNVESLRSLTNLRVLRLNSVKDLPSISFIKDFDNLLDFRFVDTNVLDGDLSPIIQHPTMVSCAFNNKRHYNLTVADVTSRLEKLPGAERIKTVSKGPYSTFRFLDYD